MLKRCGGPCFAKPHRESLLLRDDLSRLANKKGGPLHGAMKAEASNAPGSSGALVTATQPAEDNQGTTSGPESTINKQVTIDWDLQIAAAQPPRQASSSSVRLTVGRINVPAPTGHLGTAMEGQRCARTHGNNMIVGSRRTRPKSDCV